MHPKPTLRCSLCHEDRPRDWFATKPGAPRADRSCRECQSTMRRNLPKPPKPPRKKTGPKPRTRYVVDPKTGCWVWQLALDKDGYGRLWINGRTIRAHRHFYEERFGRLLPGMVPDHRCPHGPNRACVNPDHMRPLTFEDNSRYKRTNRLTPEIAQEIRALKGRESQYRTAERYGISQSHVSAIQNGKHW